MLTRTVRGLVVSPWFAASGGFVIAAIVIVFSSHALLNPAIQVTHCGPAGCLPTQPQAVAPPVPAGAGAGKVIGGSSARNGLTFTYQMVWQNDHGFGMLITVRGEHALGSWHLTLVIPGATHLSVSGAHWKPLGHDSGTASPSGGSSGMAEVTSAAPILNPNLLISAELVRGENMAQFYISGTGTPRAPTTCLYNGAQCHFAVVRAS